MKCLVSYQPSGISSEHDASKKETSGKPVITSIRKRQELLRSFYKHVTETMWQKNDCSSGTETYSAKNLLLALLVTQMLYISSAGESAAEFPKNFLHDCPEVYLCLDHHKCYALQSKYKQLFIVSSSTIPNYALRYVHICV